MSPITKPEENNRKKRDEFTILGHLSQTQLWQTLCSNRRIGMLHSNFFQGCMCKYFTNQIWDASGVRTPRAHTSQWSSGK